MLRVYVFFLCCVAAVLMGSSSVLAGSQVSIGPGQTVPQAVGGTAPKGNVEGNSLSIAGGTVTGSAYGGLAPLGAGSAAGNVVFVSAGEVRGSVFGGMSYAGDASGNSVTIGSGVVGGDIFGGRSTTGKSVNNAVTLEEGARLSPNAIIWGGVGGVGKDEFSGNTLNVRGFQGKVFGVENFEHYNFALPSSVVNGSVLVEVTGPKVALDKSNVRLTAVGGGRLLQQGDAVTLMRKVSGTPLALEGLKVRQGVGIAYDFDLAVKGDALVASVTRQAQVTPQAPVVVKPPAASVGGVNQALDVVLGPGMKALRAALGVEAVRDLELNAVRTDVEKGMDEVPQEKAWGVRPFVAVGGGYTRFHVDDYVDLWSGAAVLGLGKLWEGDSARAMAGIFAEIGRGAYRSLTTGGDFSVEGFGNVGHEGLGLLGRLEATQGWWRGLYAEFSVRGGAAWSTFNSDETERWAGGAKRVDFSTRAPYWGAHGSLGYSVPLDEEWLLDVFAAYRWTQLGESETTILGDKVRFRQATSSVWQAGARISRAITPYLHAHVGARYEYEADGVFTASVYSLSVPKRDVTGVSFLGETGLVWRPKKDMRVELGFLGGAGKRTGLTGHVSMVWEW